MNVQYISDDDGQTTGVFIPISDWLKIKSLIKNEDLELPFWQQEELSKRLKSLNSNKEQLLDFDVAMAEIEKEL